MEFSVILLQDDTHQALLYFGLKAGSARFCKRKHKMIIYGISYFAYAWGRKMH